MLPFLHSLLLLLTTWMDLEGIMLSEINQTEEDIYCMISFICGIFKEKKAKLWDFPGGPVVKNQPAMRETRVQSLGWEYPQRRAWQPTAVFLPGESP